MRSIIGEAPGRPGTAARPAGHGAAFSPPLVRLLAQWQAGGASSGVAAGNPTPLTERLGQWLDWTDAIRLSALLNQPATAPAPAAPNATSITGSDSPAQARELAQPPAQTPARTLAQALARVRAEQARAIHTDPAALLAGTDAGADFAPFRRACQARQRAMGAAATTLRARLRAALAATSPAGARLAALDDALEAALAERERHLLGSVVAHIEQRFLRARQAAAPGWAARFQQDMQQALMAELDLRLQPAQGLLAALADATGQELAA